MITFKDYIEEKRGLWDNIHAKRKRIKAGSGEHMRKPGSKGAPSEADLKAANEEVQIDEIVVALAPIDVRNPKKTPQPQRYMGDIVPPTKPPSTEKRGVKGRPGQRPMPTYEEVVAEDNTAPSKKYHVTVDHHGANRDVPLYTRTYPVHAKSEHEAIGTIHKLVGGRNHRVEHSVAEENTQGDEGTDKLTKHRKKLTPNESPVTPELLKNFETYK